jgi:hypothetical protein
MFLHEMIAALQKGTWELDCVNITLTQNDTAEPTVFSGPGYLRQGEGGTVEYKVYPTTSHEWNVWEKQFGGVEGKLIESSRYYTLKATDRFGRCWEWWRTMPEISSSALETGVHHVIDGKTHELAFSRRSDVPEDVFNLKMFFFADVEIPCNARTEVITLAGGERRQTSSLLNVAQFSTPIGEFHVSNQAGLVLVELDSGTPLPAHIEIRIVEALGLVLARPLFWNVIERYENRIETVRVRGQSIVANAKLLPPVGRGPIDMTGEVWRLFEKYLTFICAYPEDRFHPCSRHLFSALEASAGTINAQALALGVAVEGIVKKLFPKAGSLPDGLKPKVKQLRKHFKKWEALKDEQTKAALWKRVQDMLGRLLEVSTKSKLHALAAEKAVYEEHVEAWGAIRNTSAHGETPGSENLQTLVDLCHKVMVLMYHLIFRAVGFEGVYIDYSTHGWRSKRYRGRPPTEEEIAVAAYFLWKRNNEEHGHDREHWFKAKELLEQGII